MPERTLNPAAQSFTLAGSCCQPRAGPKAPAANASAAPTATFEAVNKKYSFDSSHVNSFITSIAAEEYAKFLIDWCYECLASADQRDPKSLDLKEFGISLAQQAFLAGPASADRSSIRRALRLLPSLIDELRRGGSYGRASSDDDPCVSGFCYRVWTQSESIDPDELELWDEGVRRHTGLGIGDTARRFPPCKESGRWFGSLLGV
jgi:hypothetical protein